MLRQLADDDGASPPRMMMNDDRDARHADGRAPGGPAQDVLLNRPELKWPLRGEADRFPGEAGGPGTGRIPPQASFKIKASAALKDAITKMDIYASSEPI